MSRRNKGEETWERLLNWQSNQGPAERLSAHILRFEGYRSIDPSHPLGGPDGLKDIVCKYNGTKWIGAAYYPRGQKKFKTIKDKFKKDAKGIEKNDANGIAFLTNQELSLSERDELKSEVPELDLFHLERIANLLDTPACYGLRLDYLSIEMSKEEQLAFFSTVSNQVEKMSSKIDQLQKQVISSNNKADAVTVDPNYDMSFASGSFGLGRRLHNCSNCNFGYYINNYGIGAPAAVAMGVPTVTCPNCGNTERISIY